MTQNKSYEKEAYSNSKFNSTDVYQGQSPPELYGCSIVAGVTTNMAEAK